MTIILSSPMSMPEVASASARSNRPMVWTGFDGSQWPLTRPGSPNPRLAPGVKGLHMPPMTVHSSSAPLVPGVEITGYELPARPVYWPLMFRAASAAQWEIDHAGMFDSFHPVLEGNWTVGDGENARTLPLTGTFDGSHVFDHDPFVTGHALIGVELLAPRPLWRGKPIVRTLTGPRSTPFIPAGGGPPFHIVPGSTFQNAEIDNPGDEPSYLTWTVEGPFETGAVLGVGAALIEVPFAIAAGSVLIINTDPAGQYATLDGTDCARALGFQLFAPIPPRGTSSIVIRAEGEGSVRAEHTPLYWRAF